LLSVMVATRRMVMVVFGLGLAASTAARRPCMWIRPSAIAVVPHTDPELVSKVHVDVTARACSSARASKVTAG
jgi:hypothetical protein